MAFESVKKNIMGLCLTEYLYIFMIDTVNFSTLFTCFNHKRSLKDL